MTFLLIAMVAIQEGGKGSVTYHIECGSTKDHFSSSFWAEEFNV